ncbi:MAG: penicillin-binding protein [Bacteroidota bacterium]
MDINTKGDILWRIYLVYFLTVGFAVVILFKVVYLQFVEGEKWHEMARNSTMRYMDIDAVRGDILADDGRLLATSVPVYEIRMDLDRRVVDDQVFYAGIDSLSYHLSMLFKDRSKAEYKRVLVKARSEQQRYFLVKRNVSYNQLIKLREFPVFRLGRFKGGLIVVENNRRETPFRSLAHRTIGYEREGVYVGLEGAYRNYLEGKKGKRLMQRISGGNWMPLSDENEIKPLNGKDIVTSLNIHMQDIVENALRKQLSKFNAQHGSAIVMEVNTGRIKAISNLSRTDHGSYLEAFNYAVGESAEPGSTFKLASMIAALEDKVVDPGDFIDTNKGTIRFADRIMRDAKPGGFGTINLKEAFALSSNVAISKVIHKAYGEEPQKFLDQLDKMGLSQPLGVEIKGEVKPYIPNIDDPEWSRVTLPWMSIGYGVMFTPLQILTLYNAVANNGVMMKPMFVDEVRQTGKSVEIFKPQVIKNSICSEQTLRIVQDMLEEVVLTGTGSSVHSEVLPIAGKTGTSQVSDGIGYRRKDGVVYRASFAGYFPANDPVYSMIVVIHDPKGYVYTGSQVAAPAFKEIAHKIFATQIDLPQTIKQEKILASLPLVNAGSYQDIENIYDKFNATLVVGKDVNTWSEVSLGKGDTVVIDSRNIVENLVPNVYGMGLKDALYLLENNGMKVRFIGRGVVKYQSIKPGTRIQNGSVIYLELS